MGLEIDASELNRLAVDFGSLPLRAAGRVRTAVAAAGLKLAIDAKAAAPVDTGFLRGSIGVDTDPDGLGVVVGPTAEYGPYVEFGTSRMAPRAFMSPAFDRVAPGFVAAVEQIAGDL